MANEKNKWIDAVGKLITLTQERKLLWRSTNNYNNNYEADYGGKSLRLYLVRDGDEMVARLAVMDPQTAVEWEFPYSEASEHLIEAVRYQLVGVGEFLDELLTHAV